MHNKQEANDHMEQDTNPLEHVHTNPSSSLSIDPTTHGTINTNGTNNNYAFSQIHVTPNPSHPKKGTHKSYTNNLPNVLLPYLTHTCNQALPTP